MAVLAAQAARASIKPHDDLQAVLMTMAVTESKTPRQTVITLDRNALIAALLEKEQEGVLNPIYTAGYINAHKNSLAIVTGLVHSAMELDDAYKNTTIARSHVQFVMELADDYGHRQKIPLFDFDFNRALYDKIDWDRFDPASLPKAALNFRYSPWAKMSAEP